MDLAQARVLISNDDGIDAEGLRILEEALIDVVKEVWVVAPSEERSAAGHAITMRQPLFADPLGPLRYMVNGTPTDCVLLAVHRLMLDGPPDLVLSGVNKGGNLGEDITYSGTVGAAMEGALLGIPSIAFSQFYNRDHPVPWATAAEWIIPVLQQLMSYDVPNGTFLNVNFPDVAASEVTGIEVTHQGRRKIGGDILQAAGPDGRPYYRIGRGRREDPHFKGSDLAALHSGAISVTPMTLDLTDRSSIEDLRGVLNEA